MSTSPARAISPPSLETIREARARLAPWIHRTPVWSWRPDTDPEGRRWGEGEVWLKLELLQRTGTFKARGAILNLLELGESARARGVTAVSAGNHAIAVAAAASLFASTAKVVMPRSADPFRVRRVGEFGGEVVLVEDVHEAFERVQRIASEEGRTFIHPFESELTILGQATLGLEIGEQIGDLDALLIPVGGGGLAAGVASAMRALQPRCRLVGVEPEGADTMRRSFAAGSPQAIERVATIADSLGAPRAEPRSFALCHALLDEVVTVTDDALRDAMRLLFGELKLACEPACAATTAARTGPLAGALAGRRTALVLCGSNIGLDTWSRLVGG